MPITDQTGKPLAIELPLGTAFFVFYPDPRGGSTYGFIYLVTAKHVLQDTDGTFLKEVKVRLNLKEPSPGKQFNFLSIPASDDRGNLLWFHDTDGVTDVAIAPLLPDEKKFDFLPIPIAMFADDELIKREKVVEEDSLNFVGLMSQYYGDSKNYPVVRRGTLALMTDEEIDTPTGRQRAFIAELASWPGNSGSPVFLNLGGFREGSVIVGMSLHLLGILSGSFLNRVRGSTVDTATIVGGNELNTGISFIVPAVLLTTPRYLEVRGRPIQRGLICQYPRHHPLARPRTRPRAHTPARAPSPSFTLGPQVEGVAKSPQCVYTRLRVDLPRGPA